MVIDWIISFKIIVEQSPIKLDPLELRLRPCSTRLVNKSYMAGLGCHVKMYSSVFAHAYSLSAQTTRYLQFVLLQHGSF